MDWNIIGVVVDVVGVVISIVLAIIGTIIAYRQLKGEQRVRDELKKEEEKRAEEKESIKGIMQSLDEASKCEELLDDFKKKIYKNSKRKDNDPGEFANSIDDLISEHKKIFDSFTKPLNNLYSALIVNEDRFPMAHGYGRYIEDLRVILNYDLLRRQLKMAGYDRLMSQFAEIHNYLFTHQEFLEKDEFQNGLLKLGELADPIFNSLSPLFDHAEKISDVINELKIKYKQK